MRKKKAPTTTIKKNICLKLSNSDGLASKELAEMLSEREVIIEAICENMQQRELIHKSDGKWYLSVTLTIFK